MSIIRRAAYLVKRSPSRVIARSPAV